MPVKAKSEDWESPHERFDELNAEFGPFTFEPACTPEQYSAQRVLEQGGTICVPPDYPLQENAHILVDGLRQPWHGRVFLNPPYTSRSLYRWVSYAVEQVSLGNVELVCAFLPANKTEQAWWQEFVCKEAAYDRLAAPAALHLVRWLPKRQRYIGAGTAGATFASCVVVWQPD